MCSLCTPESPEYASSQTSNLAAHVEASLKRTKCAIIERMHKHFRKYKLTFNTGSVLLHARPTGKVTVIIFPAPDIKFDKYTELYVIQVRRYTALTKRWDCINVVVT